MDHKSPKALLKNFPGQAAAQEKQTGGERETKDALRRYLSSSSPPPTTTIPVNEIPPRPQATGFSPPPTTSFNLLPGTSSDPKNSNNNNNSNISINSNLSSPPMLSQLPGLTPSQQQQQPQQHQPRPPSSQPTQPQLPNTKSSAKAVPLPLLKPTVLPRTQRSTFDTILVTVNILLAFCIMFTVVTVAILAYAVKEGNNSETLAFSSIINQVFNNGINMNHVTNQVMDMGQQVMDMGKQMFNQQSSTNTATPGGWLGLIDLGETGGGFVQQISMIYTQATNYIQKTSIFEQIKLTVDDIILSIKLSFS